MYTICEHVNKYIYIERKNGKEIIHSMLFSFIKIIFIFIIENVVHSDIISLTLSGEKFFFSTFSKKYFHVYNNNAGFRNTLISV